MERNPSRTTRTTRRCLGFAALAAFTLLPFPAAARLSSLSSLYVLGDSLSDGGGPPGNPVGSNGATFSQATLGTVFPPPPYAGGRASNGPVAVEYLWNQFNPGRPPLLPSQLGGTNYAIVGATTGLQNNLSPNSRFPQLDPVFAQKGMASQLASFLSRSPSFDPASSLFVVWAFPNDLAWYGRFGTTPGTVAGTPGGLATPQQLIGNAVGNILGTISSLAAKGATNFLVPNSPDLGTTPAALANPATALQASLISAGFNQALESELTRFDATFPGDIIQFQTDDLLADVQRNPAAYGFTNVRSACIDASGVQDPSCDPSTWLFWDDLHPTTTTHALLGRSFYAAVSHPVPGPLPVFGAAAAFGWSRRLRRRIGQRGLPCRATASPLPARR